MSERQRRELGAFARYCAQRIERELGAVDQWTVSMVTGVQAQYASVVSVRGLGGVEGRAFGRDAVLTMWDAMSRLEQRIRESRPGARYDRLLA